MFYYILKFIDEITKKKFSIKIKNLSQKSIELDKYIQSFKGNFTNLTQYLDYSFEKKYIHEISNTINIYNNVYKEITEWDRFFDKYYLQTSFEQSMTFNLNYLKKIDISNLRKESNSIFIEDHKKKFYALFNNVENRKLDEKQQECIIKNELNNLVVAGAGSGKTTTIVGKVKYLINVLNYSPQEILVISFTKKSAEEMKSRIEKSLNCNNINAMTFHKLGLNITRLVEGKSRIVSKQSKIINNLINEFLDTSIYRNKFNKFFLEHLTPYKSKFEFKTLADYTLYLKENEVKTIDKKVMKSMEEVSIANFLFMNNINYEYEKQYSHYKWGKYKPDFYLPDYNIYIEHFGIARDGSVPCFFKGVHGRSPRETYHAGMEWKKSLHVKNNTTLIETFSYEKFEGNLIEKLKTQLKSKGVDLIPKSESEVFLKIKNDYENDVSHLRNLISSFINYMRSNNISLDFVTSETNKLKVLTTKIRASLFLELISPIINKYENQLTDNREVDFSDMINKAVKFVKENKYISSYKYIIIDEYQDISQNKLDLIKGLKNQTAAKLFCVGDDWQSIYKFTGSKIDFFTSFDKHVGYTEHSKLENTFRCNQRIVKASSEFIQKNTLQVKKKVLSFSYKKELENEILKYKTTDDIKIETALEKIAEKNVLDVKKSVHLIYHDSIQKKNNPKNIQKICNHIYTILEKIPKKASVSLLGRYSSDLKPFIKDKIIKENKGLTFIDRKDIALNFLTIHSSKGLESDYIIILNNTNSKLGFPSNIEDDIVFDLIRKDDEEYPYAEERRLFYVALTRTKNDVFLLVDRFNKSTFVNELEVRYGFNDKNSTIKVSTEHYCPKCNSNMIYRSGEYGDFWGCENYPYCKGTLSIKLG